MVFRLVQHILNDTCQMRLGNSHNSIFALPSKRLQGILSAQTRGQVRGIAFYLPDEYSQCHGGRRGGNQVDMIRNGINGVTNAIHLNNFCGNCF